MTAPRHRPLTTTYRLQVHKEFTFADARRIVPYLERLGVSHVYSSPILRARPGSTHGYDVADPTRANPELGGEPERRRLARALRQREMGLLLDIVPNHMGSGSENPFWEDVLTHGTASRYAPWFDIRWQTPEQPITGRVLLPVLGDKLTKVLERGELSVAFEDGRFRIRYFDDSFPVDPASYPLVLALALRARRGGSGTARPADLDALRRIVERLERLPRVAGRPSGAGSTGTRAAEAEGSLKDLAALYRRSAEIRTRIDRAASSFSRGAAGRARMRALVDAQPYRLAFWKRAARLINYRRFFDINELVALQMEDPRVFDETHALVLDWVRDGEVNGLRIDHIDGLLDPRGYLERLRSEVAARRPPGEHSFPILVEKILSPGERLREDWPVQGTTGYEFLNDLESIFIDPGGFATIERRYRELLPGRGRNAAREFSEVAYRGKVNILTTSLSADVARLARLLQPIARRDARVSSLSRARLAKALVEWIACFPVYRTYVDGRPPEPHPADREVIERAAARCRERAVVPADVVNFLCDTMLELGDGAERSARLRFVGRLQQTSGPATAKGVEDTALYVHVPLVSLNEVGGEPERPLDRAVEIFHRANAERAARWRQNLLSTNTHDTKRSADVRARIDVLSEIPDVWMDTVQRWREMNRPLRARRDGEERRTVAPDPNTEYLLYQTLLGAWPLAPGGWSIPGQEELGSLRERIGQYMLKAVREAKTHTSWTNPDEEYERGLAAFIEALLPRRRAGESPFLRELAALAARVTRAGLWNSLGRVVAHLTAPGTPDLYQGDELWNFSLVDPDNRRPVDYGRRRRLLAGLERRSADGSEGLRRLLRQLMARPEDDRLKLYVIWRAAQARRANARLVMEGGYEPLPAVGAGERHIVSFARQLDGAALVTVLVRLSTYLSEDGAPPVGKNVWGDTRLRLPKGAFGQGWRCLLGGQTVAGERDGTHLYVTVSDVLQELPVAILVPEHSG